MVVGSTWIAIELDVGGLSRFTRGDSSWFSMFEPPNSTTNRYVTVGAGIRARVCSMFFRINER